MSNELVAIRADLLALQGRMLAVYSKVEGDPHFEPLRTIATSISTFAEMLPFYGRFVELMEATTSGLTAPP